MRKSKILLYVLIAFSTSLNAQQSKVTSAYKYLKDFWEYKEVESLNKAKEAIDDASKDEKTQGEPKTWLYRAKIYQAAYENNLRMENEKQPMNVGLNDRTLVAYQKAQTEDLFQAQASYMKAKELDVKGGYGKEINQKLDEVAKHLENSAISNYNIKNFNTALPLFQKAYETNVALKGSDTTNISNIAVTAQKANKPQTAIDAYKKKLEGASAEASDYAEIAKIYMSLGEPEMHQTYVAKGRERYPDNVSLLIEETNIYLKQNKTLEAVANLKAAIQRDPKNAQLYAVLANRYDIMANPKDDKGNDLAKPKNYQELIAGAEENYKKAIEINPEHFDALYNLGMLYNNVGAEIVRKADDIMDDKKFKAESQRATEQFSKAIPYLEKVISINPDDPNVDNAKTALKQAYIRTGQTEKANSLK